MNTNANERYRGTAPDVPVGRHAAGRHVKAAPAQTRSEQTRSEQTRSEQTRPEQARPVQVRRAQAQPSRRTNQARTAHAATRNNATPSKRRASRRPSTLARLLRVQGKPRKSAVKRPRKPLNRENVKTALFLWCFPVGLSLMWRRSCTWHKGVKAGISAVMAAILLAVIIAPIPRTDRQISGVQMVSGNPEVEVYGPALPSLIVPGYTNESTGSIIVDAVNSEVHYVYAAEGARCYHEYDCKFAFASSQRLTVYEAHFLGYDPCGRCKPPVYTPGSELTVATVAPDEEATT